MTTANTSSETLKDRGRFRLPDIPDREPDEVTQYDTLFKDGNSHALKVHLGHRETTLVEADRWIIPTPEFDKRRARYPDLLVAFGVDPQAYAASKGYVVSEQGKPPDFVLEVASESTAQTDVGPKRNYYAAMGIPEYWRFDETGDYHGTKLAADRLVNGQYQPVVIQELPGGMLQAYSPALNLNLRWTEGDLIFEDPVTGQPIATLESERARADTEREARLQEQARADAAQARADAEQQAREAAEARVRELEERYGERPSARQE